jgi:hypothetical protein
MIDQQMSFQVNVVDIKSLDMPAPKAQVSGQREQPAKQANTTERKQIGDSARRPELCSVEVVAEDGIEPPTQGFSVLCSTD